MFVRIYFEIHKIICIFSKLWIKYILIYKWNEYNYDSLKKC